MKTKTKGDGADPVVRQYPATGAPASGHGSVKGAGLSKPKGGKGK